ncbi:charged multivesicular body protein 6-A [Phlebotomus papatasi]|uniref:charged multivesicular body protein 6-A n=1 Tax=Phlebotomus papatasi TaxID=29031 RepID=UPI00248402B2|nr:charged multivesicular body protein 6-A [Phlebotomus papatasi]
MGGLFAKSKKTTSRITEQDKAVLQLKQQRDKLKQYQKRIEISLEKDRELVKKCLNSKRIERAKLLLRKKRYQTKLLENTDAQLENLEKLASDIEFAQVEIQVVEGLKVGNMALKSLHQILSVDEIERIMDETREGVEKQQELDEILSGRLTEEDENDILEELDNLVALDDAEKAKENASEEDTIADQLPNVPTDLPEREKTKRKKEEPKIALTA